VVPPDARHRLRPGAASQPEGTIYAEADGKALKDPDPSDKTQTAFSWMTIHKYTADRKVNYPFTDRSTLGK
jgi:hypothetical protein